MKKILATATAVVLSLAMVAMPSVAMADEVAPAETVTTETVTEAVVEPAVTEAVVTEPVAEPVVTEPVAEPAAVPAEVSTTQGELTITRNVQTTAKPEDTGPTTDQLCTDITDGSYGPKIDANANDPFSVYIPDGKTLVAYCVKAGTDPRIVDENTDAPNDGTLPFEGPGWFVIDHAAKDSVSHYQLKLVDTEVEDVCENLPEVQTEIPDGYVLDENGDCVPEEEEDVCENLDDIQTEVPDGYVLDENGDCVVDEEEDLVVTVTGEATHQECVESGDESVGTYTQGSIQLTISDLAGVTKIEYSKDGGSTSEVNLGGDLLLTNLAPGTYTFVVTVATGYEAVADFDVKVKADNNPECKKQTICHWTPGGQGEDGKYVEIDVSIKSIINVPNGHKFHEHDVIPPFDYYDDEDNLVSFPGLNWDPEAEGCDDFELPDLALVIPHASQDPGCELPSFFTIGNSDNNPEALSWTANGEPIAEGTHNVTGPETIHLVATGNGPEHGIEPGAQSEWTFTFPADESCGELSTLALTGSSDITPALALTAFLGLLGLAMVRSGIRVNRIRQEA